MILNTQSNFFLKGAIKRIILHIGDDPNREGLKETPERIIKSWSRLYGGYKQKAEEVLGTVFSEYGNYDEMIILKNIDFFSTCEHHMLPFYGKAHIAYLPNKKIVGISKLARLVEMHSRRLQIQERLTSDIANDINRILKPKGVAVLVEAQHFCIKARGIEKINSIMTTNALLGVFRKPEVRAEFFSLVKE